MADKLYWVAVDFDHHPTEDEMRSLTDALDEELDHDAIVTTKEVEPMGKEELKDYFNTLAEEVGSE